MPAKKIKKSEPVKKDKIVKTEEVEEKVKASIKKQKEEKAPVEKEKVEKVEEPEPAEKEEKPAKKKEKAEEVKEVEVEEETPTDNEEVTEEKAPVEKEEVEEVEKSTETREEDLSKYTIGSSGEAPAQEKEGTVTGFGLKPKNTKKEKIPLEIKNKRLYMIGVVLSLVVLGVTSTLLYLRIKQEGKVTEEVVTETVEVVEAEQEVEKVVPIPRKEITIDVLNGSGVAGAAAKVADVFENLGYKIGEVGNADSTEGSKVYLNTEVDKDLLDNLWEDFKDELGVEKSSGDFEDSTSSAKIILGE